MTKFNILVDSIFHVTDEAVVFKGIEYPVSRINSLTLCESKQSLNFVTTLRMRTITIGFNDGRWVQYWCGSPILRKTKFTNLLKVFEVLSPLTFRQRYQSYADALETEGYFDYDEVRIYADGTISTIRDKNEKWSLWDAHSEKRLGLGVSYGVSWIGYSESDPYSVAFYKNAHGGFFTSGACIRFKCLVNRDVIITLLKNNYRAFP